MKYRLLLLLAALIWGGAFVAQRMSTETIGPYGFNGIRFFMGALSVLPIVLYTMHCGRPSVKRPPKWLSLPIATLILGIILFSGNAFQQVGLYYTTAGKAGFITALYIIAVPILGLLLHNPLRLSHAIGCIVAVAGLYLLAFHADAPLNQGMPWSCAVSYSGRCTSSAYPILSVSMPAYIWQQDNSSYVPSLI
jgi:drug/metabolite transporter (DMT)-like permease